MIKMRILVSGKNIFLPVHFQPSLLGFIVLYISIRINCIDGPHRLVALSIYINMDSKPASERSFIFHSEIIKREIHP
jgi:hypothetical protein